MYALEDSLGVYLILLQKVKRKSKIYEQLILCLPDKVLVTVNQGSDVNSLPANVVC